MSYKARGTRLGHYEVAQGFHMKARTARLYFFRPVECAESLFTNSSLWFITLGYRGRYLKSVAAQISTELLSTLTA